MSETLDRSVALDRRPGGQPHRQPPERTVCGSWATSARRNGGAGPADAGMLWIDGAPATVPTDGALRRGLAVRACGRRMTASASTAVDTRLADASLAPRPRYYDLETADGIPYWKIALMHLDSMASTVLQTCAYWGNSDQCTFCGIGVSLAARSHDRQEDPGDAGRGLGRRAGPRRRRRRDPDDRQHRDP